MAAHVRPARQRGVSLIEALVAMIVMAFGTLAVLGVQTSLRFNGDVSRQRAEAVRIAQESIEAWRGFEALTGNAEGVLYYADLANGVRTVAGTNASFTVTETVVASVDPKMKMLQVVVGWQDRSAGDQQVQLVSTLFGVSPSLAGTLVITSESALTRNPGGRHPAVPPGAINEEGGASSRFTPPGGDGLTWVFDNTTGYITHLCDGPEDVNCPAFDARLLTGYVRFATGSSQPTGVQSEVPPSFKPTGDVVVEVRVNQTAPATEVNSNRPCFEDQSQESYVTYYCAVPVGAQTNWSGRSEVIGLTLANNLNDDNDHRRRICRYTPFRDHRTAPANMSNEQHPLNYVEVGESLTNQNFLVIRAGDDHDPFTCPDDNESTPYVNGTTWHHQPSS